MVTTNRMVSIDGHIPILDDIYAESSTQKAPLGLRMAWADGRIYKYFQNGAGTLTAGKTVQTCVYSTGWDTSWKPTGTVSAGATQIPGSCTLGTSVIDTNIEVTALVDGFMSVRSGGGQGYIYQIKSHTAISSNSAATINLYDPIKVALTAGATCALTRNPYKDLVIGATGLTGAIVGVAVIASTADYFGWCQTWGFGVGMWDVTRIVSGLGGSCTKSVGTAGYITGISTAGPVTQHAVIAETLGVGIADQFCPVFWKISP